MAIATPRHSTNPALVAVFALLPVVTARADQIVTPTKNYAGVKVLALRDGDLRFRAGDDQIIDLPLGKIQMIVVDRAPFADDFNEAETLMSKGEAEKAAARYERALRLSADYWSEIIIGRLIVAHDQAQHLDEAAEYFVRLTQGQFSGARAAAYLFPESATPTRNARYTRAVHVLDTALSLKLTEGQRLVLELLRYDVFRRLDDQRMADSAAALAKLPVPAYMATTKVCGILESALRTAMSGGAEPAEFVTLNQAIERCPDQSLPGLLLLKGDVLLGRAQTRDEIIRASWPYMRVAIHMPDGPRAAEALFRTGQALARIGSHDRAQSLLAECLAHPQATEEIKRQAQALQTSGQNAKRPSP